MKQTALKWLENNLIFDPWAEEHFKYNEECWEIAKAMEKEQIQDAWLSAWKDSMLNPLEDKYYEPEAEQYYNETYK